MIVPDLTFFIIHMLHMQQILCRQDQKVISSENKGMPRGQPPRKDTPFSKQMVFNIR